MGWSTEFASRLGGVRRDPVYRLIVHSGYGATSYVSGQTPPGQPLTICSAEGYGATSFGPGSALQIGNAIRVDGSRVNPVSWSVSVGGFSVELSGRIGSFRSHCPRGALCSLEMGFVGWDVSRFQRIALSRFRMCESEGYGVAVRHTAQFDGLGSFLQNRIAENWASGSLFHGAGGGSTLAATYNGTAGSLQVASASEFERETGATGVMKITPASGDPDYYVKWTGVAGTTFTISPSTELFNTARVSAASGSAVTNVIYLSGHPIDLLLRILISGNGSAATHNKYPDSWGYRIPLDLIDIGDAEHWRDQLTTGSGYSWESLVSESQEDAWSWVSGYLAVDGIWPVLRQGQITARYVQPIYAPVVRPTMEITDSDLVGNWRLVDWDPDQPVEHAQLVISNRNGHTTSDTTESTLTADVMVETLPLKRRLEIDVEDRVWDNALGDAMRPAMTDRHKHTAFRVGELLTLPLRLNFAQLCPGDLVTVSLPQILGRCLETMGGYVDQPCMVTGVSVDYGAGVATVTVHTHAEL